MIQQTAVRFGGREVDGKFLFELTGGALALDFVNTLDERPGGGIERLTTYERFLEWSVQSGALPKAATEQLSRMANRAPGSARSIAKSARELREIIFRLIRASVQRTAPDDGDVDALNVLVSKADAKRRLVAVTGGLAWLESESKVSLDMALPRVVQSAVDLLTDPARRSRLRLCAADSCDWAFVDVSRSGRRIWCDMSVCGNRAKAKRHYDRAHATIDLPTFRGDICEG